MMNARWTLVPFWLLLLAWACASCPTTATLTACVWLAEGRSFSHQDRLKSEVARRLDGGEREGPIRSAVIRLQDRSAEEREPVRPAEEAGKKIELSLEETESGWMSVRRGTEPGSLYRPCLTTTRPPPPHGPPRPVAV